MISKTQKRLLLILFIALVLIWITVFFISAYKPQSAVSSELYTFYGNDYSIELQEYNAGSLTNQYVKLNIRRKQDNKRIITLNTPVSNHGKELKKDDFSVTFGEEFISVELHNDSGVLCGSYQFWYDRLAQIV